MLTDREDAYGHLIYEHYQGRPTVEVIERDDGLVTASSMGARAYLSPYEEWSGPQRRGMRYARGRVLDMGCGGGRHSLYLQDKGHEVVAIDNSPMAIRTCRERGVLDARVLPATQVSHKLGRFDTILMYGNNFGLVGGEKRGRWLLRRFHGMTTGRGRIIAESRDPLDTVRPEHVAYQRRNRRRGRMPGQLRIRVRYLLHCSPWFDYLLAGPQEVRRLIRGTGWYLARLFEQQDGPYTMVLEKE